MNLGYHISIKCFLIRGTTNNEIISAEFIVKIIFIFSVVFSCLKAYQISSHICLLSLLNFAKSIMQMRRIRLKKKRVSIVLLD